MLRVDQVKPDLPLFSSEIALPYPGRFDLLSSAPVDPPIDSWRRSETIWTPTQIAPTDRITSVIGSDPHLLPRWRILLLLGQPSG